LNTYEKSLYFKYRLFSMNKFNTYILLALLVLGSFSIMEKNAFAYTYNNTSQIIPLVASSTNNLILTTGSLTWPSGGGICYLINTDINTNYEAVETGVRSNGQSCDYWKDITGHGTSSPYHIGNYTAIMIDQTDPTYPSTLCGATSTTSVYAESGTCYLATAYVNTTELNNITAGDSIKTRFIDPYYPPNGTYASTSPITFSANYYYNCNTDYGLKDSVNFEFKDLTDTTQSFNTPAQPINICGQANIYSVVYASSTHQYLWRPVMYSSTASTSPIYGNWYSYLATSSPNYTPFSPFTGATIGTSTLPSTTDFLSFLNVPALLQSKVPFAYIFQIANGISEGINSSTTGTIPSGNFVWRNTQNGTTTFDFFSQNTIQTYLSPTIISLWRAFLLVILTIEFGYAIYKRTINHKII